MLVLTLLSAAGGFLFGYDTSIISSSLLSIKDVFHLSTVQQSLVVSITVAGAFLGSLLAAPLCSRFGRKPAISGASLVFTGGGILLAASQNWEMLLAGRFVVGVGVGIASSAVPVFISECAPSHLRGRLTALNIVCVSTGQFLASVVGGIFVSHHNGWRWMFLLSIVPALVQFVGFFFIPESPRYLVLRGRSAEARQVLQTLRGGSRSTSETQALLAPSAGAIDASIEVELKDIQASMAEEQGSLADILASQPLRRALFVACGNQAINQLTGINNCM